MSVGVIKELTWWELPILNRFIDGQRGQSCQYIMIFRVSVDKHANTPSYFHARVQRTRWQVEDDKPEADGTDRSEEKDKKPLKDMASGTTPDLKALSDDGIHL